MYCWVGERSKLTCGSGWDVDAGTGAIVGEVKGRSLLLGMVCLE